MIDKIIRNIDSIDILFDAWGERFSSEKLHFNQDGVISPEHWERANVKVLFVLKETNKAEQNIVSAINNALKNDSSGWWKGKVLRRVGRWAYGLINYAGEIPSFKDAKSCGKVAPFSIAYINLRKTAGGASTNTKHFDSHVEKYAPYIKRQIELIKPETVVLCGTFKPVKNHIFQRLEHVSKRIHKHNDIVFINAHHPAARTNPEDLYHQVLDSYHVYKSTVLHGAAALKKDSTTA